MSRIIAALVLSILTWPLPVVAQQQRAFFAIFEHYEEIRQVLIDDSTEGVAEHARAIGFIAGGLASDFSPRAAGVGEDHAAKARELLPTIVLRADELAAAGDIRKIRLAYAELTKPLVRYHALVRGDRPVVAYCPMEKKAWLQPDELIGNPYAPYMLRCGEVVAK